MVYERPHSTPFTVLLYKYVETLVETITNKVIKGLIMIKIDTIDITRSFLARFDFGNKPFDFGNTIFYKFLEI